MQVSRRIRDLPPSATLAVTARVAQLQAQGRDIIGFGAGEPDFDTPAHIKQAAIDALLAGHTRYTAVAGEAAARQAIAAKLKRDNGIACGPDDVVITVGGKHAIYEVLQCLLDPGQGQEVVLLTPAWVSYRPMVELAGGAAVEVPGAVERDFIVTPAQLEAAITPRTVAVILNSPSNPCGIAVPPAQLQALCDVIARHEHVTAVSDEIYEKLIYGDVRHYSPGSHPGLAGRAVTINGMSKAYAMTGWRIGYACAPGPMARAIAKLQGQMTSNITSFCYAAIVEALARGDDDVQRMREQFARRAVVIHERLSKMPGIRCPRPTGAFYVFPDVSAFYGRTSPQGRTIDSSLSFAEALLDEAGVAVVPGADFGECGQGHVRMSFATSLEKITEGCDRLERWLRSLGKPAPA